jgi:hypothetical protein
MKSRGGGGARCGERPVTGGEEMEKGVNGEGGQRSEESFLSQLVSFFALSTLESSFIFELRTLHCLDHDLFSQM